MPSLKTLQDLSVILRKTHKSIGMACEDLHDQICVHSLNFSHSAPHYQCLPCPTVKRCSLSPSLLLPLYLKYTVFHSVHLTNSYTLSNLGLNKHISFERTVIYLSADETPLPNHPVTSSTSLAKNSSHRMRTDCLIDSLPY